MNRPSLPIEKRVDLLKEEYSQLRAEVRLLLQQHSPRFTMFLVFAVSAYGLVFQNPELNYVHAAIPVVILMIAQFAIAQTYGISILGARLRDIEITLRELNGGESVIEWEHHYAIKYILPPLVDLDSDSRTRRMVNPVFSLILLMVIAGIALVSFSGYHGFHAIQSPYNWIYLLILVAMTVSTMIQGFGFFTVNASLTRAHRRSKKDESTDDVELDPPQELAER